MVSRMQQYCGEVPQHDLTMQPDVGAMWLLRHLHGIVCFEALQSQPTAMRTFNLQCILNCALFAGGRHKICTTNR